MIEPSGQKRSKGGHPSDNPDFDNDEPIVPIVCWMPDQMLLPRCFPGQNKQNFLGKQ